MASEGGSRKRFCPPKALSWPKPTPSPPQFSPNPNLGKTRRTERRLARRAEEVREIARRVVRNLTRTPFRSFAGLPDGAILVAESLRPSDAALLDPSRLAGVATD